MKESLIKMPTLDDVTRAISAAQLINKALETPERPKPKITASPISSGITLAQVKADVDIASAITLKHDGAVQDTAITGKLNSPLAITTTDVTASRVINSSYQNLTGKPLFVSVYPVYQEATEIYGSMAPTNPPWGYFVVASLKDLYIGGSQIVMLVPPDWYYGLYSDGTAYINTWIEQELG